MGFLLEDEEAGAGDDEEDDEDEEDEKKDVEGGVKGTRGSRERGTTEGMVVGSRTSKPPETREPPKKPRQGWCSSAQSIK